MQSPASFLFWSLLIVELLPRFFGLDGVLYSMPVSDFLTFLIAFFVIRSVMRELAQA